MWTHYVNISFKMKSCNNHAISSSENVTIQSRAINPKMCFVCSLWAPLSSRCNRGPGSFTGLCLSSSITPKAETTSLSSSSTNHSKYRNHYTNPTHFYTALNFIRKMVSKGLTVFVAFPISVCYTESVFGIKFFSEGHVKVGLALKQHLLLYFLLYIKLQWRY